MTETERARLLDLFRPRKLFRRLRERPTFLLATVVSAACAAFYAQLAVGLALPSVIPSLLAHSLATESELLRVFRPGILVISLIAPVVSVAATACLTWLLLRATRANVSLRRVLSLAAHGFLWVGLGFLVKAALVPITRTPEPPVNLSLFLKPSGGIESTLLAFTNPFLLLALLWSTWGLLEWGVPKLQAVVAGAGPWMLWIALLSQSTPGSSHVAPPQVVSREGWKVIEKGAIEVHYPPDFEDDATSLGGALAAVSGKLAEEFAFEQRHIVVYAHRDHRELEKACGERLHLRVAGSIRGRDVLFLEMPGHSAAVPRERGLREAMRYASLMQLAPLLAEAPRWFVEGIAHAAVFPYTADLEREYRVTLRSIGLPNYERMTDPRLYQSPAGPILARSLVDYIAANHGTSTLRAIRAEVSSGVSFRDALFAHTRLTTSALESGWQKSIAPLLGPASRRESSKGSLESPGS